MSSSMTTNAELKLNVDGFVAPMTKAQQAAERTEKAVKKSAKETADAQAVSAKYAGDAVSAQSLRIVEANRKAAEANKDYLVVQRLIKREALEGADATNAEAAAFQRKTLALEEATAASRTHAISDRMAASAVVRGLESGNVGIRAVENTLISMGAGGVLQKAFSIIGPAALVYAVVKAGAELYELEQKGKHAGEEISRAFGEMNTKLAMTNDELELSNSKLGDEIAKLEKHPTNGMQTALLEAVVAADKLQESLAGDSKALEALLKEHAVGQFSAILAGVSPTDPAAKEIKDLQKGVEKSGNDARLAYRAQMKAAGEDEAKREAATKAYYHRLDDIGANAARQMRKRATDIANAQKENDRAVIASAQTGRAGGVPSQDMTPVRSLFEGTAEIYDEMQRRAQDSGVNFSQTTKKGALEGAASAKKDGDKAAEDLLKSMDAQLNELKLRYGATIKAQYDFWEVRRSQFAAGSQAYNQVVAKEAALAEEGARKATDTIKRFREEQLKSAEGAGAIQEVMDRANYGMARDRYNTVNDTADAKRQLEAVQQGIRAKVEEQGVQDALNRTMTKAAAAAELASIHTREYGAELERLRAKQAQVAQDQYITDDERAKRLGTLAEQQASLEGNRQVQQMQDERANYHGGTSATIGAKDALDDLAIAARDSASQMKSFVESTANSVNDTILRQITGKGQRGDWTHLGQDVFSNVAGTALKKGEGALLSGFGFGGKADGSQANPLWVRMAAMADSTGGALSGVLKGAGDSAGGFLSKLGPLFSNIPFFADGGDFGANSLAVVGERGPELVRFGRSGSVTSNEDLGGLGGDTHHHTWNIDARGATDPAQVNRQIMAAAPHIAAAAVKAVHERAMRRPSSVR